jgi:hypothetical protein
VNKIVLGMKKTEREDVGSVRHMFSSTKKDNLLCKILDFSS